MKPHPLVWPAAACVAGSLLAARLPMPAWPLLAAAALLGAALAVAGWRRGRLPPALMAAAFLCLGAGLLAWHLAQAPPADDVARRADGLFRTLVGDVVSAPEPGRFGPVLLVRARSLDGAPASGLVRLGLDRQWTPPPPGARVRLSAGVKRFVGFANPGSFDYAEYMDRQGLRARAYAGKRSRLAVVGPGEVAAPRLWVERTRADLGARLDRLPPGPGRELVRALLLGQRGGLPGQVRDAFGELGAAHLLAISGLHLALVWGLGFVLLRYGLALWPRLALAWPLAKVAAAGALLPAAGYALLAGFGTPALRALIMLAVLVLALTLDRAHRPSGALALAALVITVIWPEAPLTLSFQLSFTAVAAILLAAGPLAEWVRRRTPGGRLPAAVAAWLAFSGLIGAAVWPLAVLHFHQLPLLLLPAGAVLVPLVAMITLPLALVGAAAGLLWAPAGAALWSLALLSADAACRLALWAASLPWAVRYLAGPGPWAVALFYAGALALTAVSGRVRWGLGGGLVAAALLAWLLGGAAPAPDGRLTVHILDVDQGSAAVVRLPQGQALLVDGGGWPGSDFDFGRGVLAPFLWSQGVSRLRAVACSHSHPDHAGGLPFMLRWFHPAGLWTNGEPPCPGPFGRLLTLAARRGARVLGPAELAGEHELGGARVRVVWPPAAGRPGQKPNDRSLWLGFNLGKAWVWLPGDAGPRVERAVAPHLPAGGHQALVAPHHGGKGSCTDELLARLRPQVVAVSAGCFNRFGMPRPEVLARARAAGAAVVSTARRGMITLTSDGGPWRLLTHLAAPRACTGEQISR